MFGEYVSLVALEILVPPFVAVAGISVPLIRIVKAVNRLRHRGGQGNRTTADVGISGRRGHGDSWGSQRPAIGICTNIFCGGGAFFHIDFFPVVKRISGSRGRVCFASIIRNGICRGQNIIGVGGIAPTGNIVSPFKICPLRYLPEILCGDNTLHCWRQQYKRV